MRQTYLDMAIKMAELGSVSLQATYRHSRQFLRGVTDFDDEYRGDVQYLLRRTQGSTLLNLNDIAEDSSYTNDEINLLLSKVVDVPSQQKKRLLASFLWLNGQLGHIYSSKVDVPSNQQRCLE